MSAQSRENCDAWATHAKDTPQAPLLSSCSCKPALNLDLSIPQPPHDTPRNSRRPFLRPASNTVCTFISAVAGMSWRESCGDGEGEEVLLRCVALRQSLVFFVTRRAPTPDGASFELSRPGIFQGRCARHFCHSPTEKIGLEIRTWRMRSQGCHGAAHRSIDLRNPLTTVPIVVGRP